MTFAKNSQMFAQRCLRASPLSRSAFLRLRIAKRCYSIRPTGPAGPAGSQSRPRQKLLSSTNIVLFTTGVATGLYLYQRVFSGLLPGAGSDRSTLPESCLPAKAVYAPDRVQKIAFKEITSIVGEEYVKSSKDDIDSHSDSSWQTRHALQGESPGIVVFPASTEEVSRIMKVCHKYRVPVTPYSGGTSLEGHITPVYGGITVDFSRMNEILAIHKSDLDVVVQPAVGWQELNATLAEQDLFFGPDPGPGAQIGGMIGTSCSGTNAYRYGTMKENVVNLTVVLADGTIVKTRQRPRKSAAGYNLTNIFIGSEGTLGLVTEATLKLYPKPQNESVALVTFDSIVDATDTVEQVIQSGIGLDAVELMDEEQMKFLNLSGTTERKWGEYTTLLLRFAGTKNAVKEQISQAKSIAKAHKSLGFTFANPGTESEELWSARKNALWSVFYAAPKGYMCWTTDVAVPVSHLSSIIGETKKDIVDSGLMGSILGHVGDGNFHAIICYEPTTQIKLVEGVVDRMVKRALELEGTCTGEHGVGVGKREYLHDELGSDAVDLMRKLKSSLDPFFIMNPGKVVNVVPNDGKGHHTKSI